MISTPSIDKNIVTDINKIRNIPISVNKNSIGIPLETDISSGFITKIKLNNKNSTINSIDVIIEKSSYIRDKHKDNITYFYDKYNFYLISYDSENSFVLAIKVIDKTVVDKIRYTLSGLLINRIKDVYSNSYIKRYSGENSIFSKDKQVVKLEQLIKLKPLQKPLVKCNMVIVTIFIL